jgi:mannose-6-phosphate isomerase-like protein (cupin superfamily)
MGRVYRARRSGVSHASQLRRLRRYGVRASYCAGVLYSPLAGRVAGSSDAGFVVAEWTDDSATTRERPIAGLHVHHVDDECWYVLDGRLGFVVGDEEIVAPAGSAVFVPRGTPHSFWNANTGPARYLLVMPRRLADLVQALHSDGSTDYAAIFRRYGSELL